MLRYHKPVKTFTIFIKIICQSLRNDLLITILLKKVNKKKIFDWKIVMLVIVFENAAIEVYL